MNSIQERLSSINLQNGNEVISFYDDNKLYFDNYHQITEQEKLNEFINIKLHYANALFDKSRYDLTISILKEVQEILNRLDKNHWNHDTASIHVKFLKGMIYGNKKEYNKAYLIFKNLTEKDPQNYRYKDWYDNMKIARWTWVFNLFTYGGLVLVFGNLLFDLSQISSINLGDIGLVMTFTSLISFEIIKWYKRSKRNNNKHSTFQ